MIVQCDECCKPFDKDELIPDDPDLMFCLVCYVFYA